MDPTDGETKILLIGGVSPPFTAPVDAYIPRTDSWETKADLPTQRYSLAASIGPDGRVYAFGGSDLSNILDVVEVYDFASNSWDRAPQMPFGRIEFGAALGADGRIYVVAGYNANGDHLSSVQALDVSTGLWADVPSLQHARDGVAVAADAEGRIYAIGGDYQGTPLLFVERYTPGDPAWEELPRTLVAHDNCAAAVAVGDTLYAIGGYENFVPGRLAESFFIPDSSSTWTSIAPMQTARVGFAAGVDADSHVFVFGGCSSVELCVQALDTGEMYTP
jgi:N-acetylneuraminic acid mutarotase